MPEKPLSTPKAKRILFIHPDLGIGGAERLVVDAAVGLQDRGHKVTVCTSHRDPRHCFDEARDGTLQVRVLGNTIVPPNILGRFSILCAILRQLHLALILTSSGELKDYDWVFVDQLSACIPLLRAAAPHLQILFYCHFPDYLLAPRKSLVKSLYRIPFDWFEAVTTGMAHSIVVNSNFTKSVFEHAFPRIKSVPGVVYPCVDVNQKPNETLKDEDHMVPVGEKQQILSINRFERKKNVALAIRAYAALSKGERAASRLIVAGGYDNRVAENVSYHEELVRLCDELGLSHITCKNFITSLSVPAETNVLFLLSIPSRLKTSLLNSSSLLLYTPENEHFGIVPVEALFSELPVLAHNSGGPLETVKEGVTGWLRPDDPAQWASIIRKALFEMTAEERREMGRRGKESVIAEFSKEKMAERLETAYGSAPNMSCISPAGFLLALAAIIAVVAGVAVVYLGR